jgi:hypothetical protein
MTVSISSNIFNILSCSYCGHDLKKTDNGVECSNCTINYQYTDSGHLDLRLKKCKKTNLEFEIGTPLLPDNGFQFEPLTISANPEVDFYNIDIPWHLSKEMMSYFPKAKSPNSLMLDLGCGANIHKVVCEHAGF